MHTTTDGSADVRVATPTDPRVESLISAWASAPGRSAIFDFNGTLSADEPILLRLYQEMFLERLEWTLTSRHYYSRFAGRSDREIIGVVVEELAGDDERLAAELLKERRTRYCELVEQDSPIRPATAETVLRLAAAGVPLGIVTGAQRIDVDYVLARSPIGDLFKVVITEEDVQRGKPDPQGFQVGAERMGINPLDTLVFEDSIWGVRAAKSAGMRCVAVEGTRSWQELIEEADAVVVRISPDLFAGLRAGEPA